MVHPQVEQVLSKVDAFMAKYPAITLYDKLQEVETKTGHSKVYFFLAAVVVVFGSVLLLGGSKLIVDLVGFVYPAYMSFKSIDSGSDDTQWLTYWVVFSSFSILETSLRFIVNLIPMYFWIKIVAILYLYHPKTRGAQTLYEQVLRPLLLPYLEMGKATKKSE